MLRPIRALRVALQILLSVPIAVYAQAPDLIPVTRHGGPACGAPPMVPCPHSSTCGELLQSACWVGHCTGPRSECQASVHLRCNALNLLVDVRSQRCVANNVPLKGLDMSRRDDEKCGGTTNKSCWAKDDQERDNLSFNTDSLGYVIYIRPDINLPDGRYIYVVRSSGQMLIRNYDRAKDGGRPTCPGYDRFRAQQNWRSRNNKDEYLHVRHSQLVGNNTDEVYAAGELRVKNRLVDRINNASGHYQPTVAAVGYALQKLSAASIQIAPDLVAGDHRFVSAAEDTCEPAAFSPPVDDDQELRDEL